MAATVTAAKLREAFVGAMDLDWEKRAAVFPLLLDANLWTCELTGLLNRGTVAYIDLPHHPGARAVMAFSTEAAAAAWGQGRAHPVSKTFEEICWVAASREMTGGVFIDSDPGARFMVGFSEALYIVYGFLPGALLPGMRNPDPIYPPGWHAKIGPPERSAQFQAEAALRALPGLPAVTAAYLLRVALNEHLPYLVLALEFQPDADASTRREVVDRVGEHVRWPRVDGIRRLAFVEAMTPVLREAAVSQVKPCYTAASAAT